MTHVLITGANGFIGSHLVDSQLAQGKRVRAVDLYDDYLATLDGTPGLEVTVADFTRPEIARQAVEGIDVVYHLASAHLDVSLPAERYHAVNVQGALELARVAHQAGVKRFIHCSSVGVFGNVRKPPADETSPCHPGNIYERTKHAGEQAVLAFHRESRFSLIVVRPAWVYGPRCPRTRKLMRTIAKGRFVYFGSGDNLRHPVYVSDLVGGLERCEAAPERAAGEVYILAGERPVTTKELAAEIAGVLGVNPPKLHLPLWAGSLAGTMVESLFRLAGRKPPFSSRTVEFFRNDNAFSIRKAAEQLGFEPRMSLRDGLAMSRQSI